jgi:hypothetical protein
MLTFTIAIKIILFICMCFWVWGILRWWSACAPTACEVVHDCRDVEKHWSIGQIILSNIHFNIIFLFVSRFPNQSPSFQFLVSQSLVECDRVLLIKLHDHRNCPQSYFTEIVCLRVRKNTALPVLVNTRLISFFMISLPVKTLHPTYFFLINLCDETQLS